MPALAAQLRAFSGLSSSSRTSRQLQESPPQARYRLKPMSLIIARFLLSRLENLSALLQVFQIFRGRASLACFLPCCQQPLPRPLTTRRSQDRRDCVLCSAPLHKPHRLAVARISPVASYCLVALSTRGGKTLISRLNLLPPPPAAPGRACLLCHLCPASASAHADAKPAHKYHRPKRARPLRRIPSSTLISRPMVVLGFIHI